MFLNNTSRTESRMKKIYNVFKQHKKNREQNEKNSIDLSLNFKYTCLYSTSRHETFQKQKTKKLRLFSKFLVMDGKKKYTSSGTMSRNLTSCERDTEAVRWYSTSSFRLLNLTTQRKNFPWASRNTLKCCTPSEHL